LEMDGFEVLAFLASRDLKVPIILMTSHSTAAIRKRAALAGVRYVLEKPLLDGSLVDCLHEILTNVGQPRPIIPA
jgi:two-component system, LuxR family, response regulator FixJ